MISTSRCSTLLFLGLVAIAMTLTTAVALWAQQPQPPRSCEEDRRYWREYTRELAHGRAQLEQQLIDARLQAQGLQAQVTRLQQELMAAKVGEGVEESTAPEKPATKRKAAPTPKGLQEGGPE